MNLPHWDPGLSSIPGLHPGDAMGTLSPCENQKLCLQRVSNIPPVAFEDPCSRPVSSFPRQVHGHFFSTDMPKAAITNRTTMDDTGEMHSSPPKAMSGPGDS